MTPSAASSSSLALESPDYKPTPTSSARSYSLCRNTSTIVIEGIVAESMPQGICAQTSSAAFQDVFESPELFTTINRIKALEQEDFEDDRPSPFALAEATSVLMKAAALLGGYFPRGSASVGVNQGLRITWRLPNGEVRLIVDGHKLVKSYVYMELSGSTPDLEKTISGEKLATAIRKALA